MNIISVLLNRKNIWKLPMLRSFLKHVYKVLNSYKGGGGTKLQTENRKRSLFDVLMTPYENQVVFLLEVLIYLAQYLM